MRTLYAGKFKIILILKWRRRRRRWEAVVAYFNVTSKQLTSRV
jgi:hypothetical protein